MTEEQWLTVAEIAARLKVTEHAVRGWLRSGALEGINFGGRTGYRVTEQDLVAFLERQRAGRPRPSAASQTRGEAG